MILGTGVGGGLVVNGRVVTGANAIAGEWGHNPLPWPGSGEWPGPPCYCGRTGCIETLLSGPGLARDHQGRTGRELDAAGIVARRLPVTRMRESVATYERRLARGLASVVNVFDPDAIVLGGGVSNIARPKSGCRACGPSSSSPTRSSRGSRAPSTATRAASRRGLALGLVSSPEGLCPSDSPTRSLARRFAGALPPPLKLRWTPP